MYERKSNRACRLAPANRLLLACSALATWAVLGQGADAQLIKSRDSVIRQISSANEKLELTVNTSRILTLGKRIPRMQVNNPDLLAVNALSATEIQVSAKKPGVTAINLWDEDGQIHAVDVFIYGDVRELEHALETQFPNSSIRVYRYSNALVLTGFIDRPDYVTPIVELAQDYSPKVINNISVGGVQQVLLKVKIFEVSRTKLRQLGVDFASLGGSGGFLGTSVSGLLSSVNGSTVTATDGATVQFGIVDGGSSFFGLIDALQQNQLAKILAEPNIVAVSGRPAQFNEGGEIPITIPQGLGQVSIEYKKFGTQVDFLPIVLGNGNIRLEVRPRVSDLDPNNSVTVGSTIIPGLTVREVDTAVEMKAGQTFALAGLIQRRTEAVSRGIPYLGDVPVLGVPFRRVREEVNEIELLILVTPEFVDAIDPHEAPQCYPGAGTMSPDNCELYLDGHVEVHNRCNGCGPCGCVPTHGHEPCCPGKALGVDDNQGAYPGSAYQGGHTGPAMMYGPEVYSHPTPMHGPGPETMPSPPEDAYEEGPMTSPADEGAQTHGELSMPPRPRAYQPTDGPSFGQTSSSENHYPVARKPAYQRHASKPYNPTTPQPAPTVFDEQTGLIGPVGYDSE